MSADALATSIEIAQPVVYIARHQYWDSVSLSVCHRVETADSLNHFLSKFIQTCNITAVCVLSVASFGSVQNLAALGINSTGVCKFKRLKCLFENP